MQSAKDPEYEYALVHHFAVISNNSSPGIEEILVDLSPSQQKPKGLVYIKDAFQKHIKSLPTGTILVVVIDCLRPYCYGAREADTISILRSLVELALNDSSLVCCFKIFLTLSGTALANKISREWRFEKVRVVKYDDGGLTNHAYGYTDQDFTEKVLQRIRYNLVPVSWHQNAVPGLGSR